MNASRTQTPGQYVCVRPVVLNHVVASGVAWLDTEVEHTKQLLKSAARSSEHERVKLHVGDLESFHQTRHLMNALSKGTGVQSTVVDARSRQTTVAQTPRQDGHVHRPVDQDVATHVVWLDMEVRAF